MNDSLLFQNYLVVFFDQLGQREILRKITEIPTSEEEEKHFIEVMKKSVGRILNIRKAFKNYFESAHSHKINVSLVPPEHRDEFVASQRFDLKFYGLSDAVIIDYH